MKHLSSWVNEGKLKLLKQLKKVWSIAYGITLFEGANTGKNDRQSLNYKEQSKIRMPLVVLF
jgi:hypothetical protein